MRITIPVSGDGEAWMAHLPEINFDPENLLENGKLILPRVIELFVKANDWNVRNFGRQMFLLGNGDAFNVFSMTVEFLRQLAAVTHWVESLEGSTAHVSSDGSKQDQRLERRMNKGRVAFCRIDVRNVATGVKFTIGYANPKDCIIGNCGNGAHEFAIYVARIIMNMAEMVNRQSAEQNAGLVVTVEGRDPCLLAEAERREVVGRELRLIREANEKRTSCPNNRNGYCSPFCPECRCYKAGRCVNAELTD